MFCTFFGHRDTDDNIKPILKDTIIDLIENQNVSVFYVGSEGNFDSMVIECLRELSIIYSNIKYFVVLAYMPKTKEKDLFLEKYDTIYPDGLEKTLPRFAIYNRNRWMVKNSDYVVAYVSHSFGGAAQFVELAEREEKVVINLYEFK